MYLFLKQLFLHDKRNNLYSIFRESVLIFSFIFLLISPIFSQNTKDQKVIISEIKTAGNKKTKAETILRELTFKKNDSIFISDLKTEIEKSKKNLLNTPLFNTFS